MADYNKALMLNPKLAAAYANRGLTQLELGKDQAAAQDLDKAVELDATLKPQLEKLVDSIKQKRADAPATKSYVNKAEGLRTELREAFVDFSLDYPASWKLVRGSDPEAEYFIKLTDSQPDAPIEREFLSVLQFNLSKRCVSLDDPEIKDTLSKLLGQVLDETFKHITLSFTAREKIDERRITIGKYDAYELRFRAVSANEGSNKIPVWGRIILIPGVMKVGQGTRGVGLLMYASALAPEIKGIEDVGVKGGLRVALDSFKLSPPDLSNRVELKPLRVLEMAMVPDTEQAVGASRTG
ncbi:MAG: hypothetical protein M3362_26365, partial [Acidobacteriota bacterium]|nr:hypothetical protein [Acidobacteriota bacterium]